MNLQSRENFPESLLIGAIFLCISILFFQLSLTHHDKIRFIRTGERNILGLKQSFRTKRDRAI
ncbi:hypothetical protein [Lusitaniella coriacea]|uniref:hypothetical protein n=1 Tax=Lusitaniella coriacea TaxID=1983105 RepID=UPI003CEBBCC2